MSDTPLDDYAEALKAELEDHKRAGREDRAAQVTAEMKRYASEVQKAAKETA